MKKELLQGVIYGVAAIWAASTQAADGKERFTDWEVEVVVDKLDDATRGIAVARSIGTPKAALVIKCDAEGEGIYAHIVGPYQGETPPGETRPFVYRVDKQSKTEELWRYVKGGAVQFDAEKARWFARFIMNGKTLVVRQYNYEFATTDITFPIAGAKEAMERVFTICKATF